MSRIYLLNAKGDRFEAEWADHPWQLVRPLEGCVDDAKAALIEGEAYSVLPSAASPLGERWYLVLALPAQKP